MDTKRQKLLHSVTFDASIKSKNAIDDVNNVECNKSDLPRKRICSIAKDRNASRSSVIKLKTGQDKNVFIYKKFLWKLTKTTKNTHTTINRQIKCLSDLKSEPFVAKYYETEKIRVSSLNQQNVQESNSVVLQKFEWIRGFDLKNHEKLEQHFQDLQWREKWIENASTYIQNTKKTNNQGDENEPTLPVGLDSEILKTLKPKLLLCLMLATQLESIWSKGWCHGDIKSGNIILSPSKFQTFWIDFEYCSEHKDPKSFHTGYFQGSVYWVPPSVLPSMKKAITWNSVTCKRKDIWGLIATMYWIITGSYVVSPFPQESNSDYLQRLSKMTHFPILNTGSLFLDQSFTDMFSAIEQAKEPSDIDSLLHGVKSFLYRLCF